MPDDKSKRGPHDSSRVNVNEDYEVRYWCKEFSCTRQQLEEAVKEVGTSAAEVRKYFGK